jgi:VWFA-related protein
MSRFPTGIRALLGALVGIALPGTGAWSSSTQQSASEVTVRDSPAVFKSHTNLVQVPVVVRDAKGRAVGNLRAEDFQLFDSGKPQLISRFSVEQFQTNENLEIREKMPDGREVSAGSLPNRFVAFLVDDVNLDLPYMAGLHQAEIRQIESFRPTDRAAVYTVSGRTMLDFTGDRELLRQTLLGIVSLNRGLMYKTYPMCLQVKCRCQPMTYYKGERLLSGDAKLMEECIGQPAPTDADRMPNDLTPERALAGAKSVVDIGDTDVANYYRVLSGLVAKLSAMPGERSILLVSPGQYVPLRLRQTGNEILASAIRAKVVINGVDARGQYGGGHYTGDEYETLKGPDTADLGEQAERLGFMDDLTAGTGGMFIRGNNDMVAALARANSVPEFVYVLGFSPQDLKLDGRRHSLKVTLKNSRGFDVRFRNSYYAAGYSEDPAEQVKRQIEETVFSSEESDGLPVRVQTQTFHDGDDGTLTVIAKVDATKLSFRKAEGRNRDDLTIVVGLFDQNGNYLAGFQKIVEMRLKDETLAAWLRSGIEEKTDFSVKPGRYLVRIVVRDSEGQSMAAHSTGVNIP